MDTTDIDPSGSTEFNSKPKILIEYFILHCGELTGNSIDT